jgi:hypothetical protein
MYNYSLVVLLQLIMSVLRTALTQVLSIAHEIVWSLALTDEHVFASVL